MRDTGDSTADALVGLPGTGWRLWRSVILRGPGFAADGLDRLAAPAAAAVADAHLAGRAGAREYAAAHDLAVAGNAKQLCEIADDPRFREAVTWQSPTSVSALDGLVAAGPAGPRGNRRREREIVITRYWQRYCGKNDTIGFFGPVGWATLDPDGPTVTQRPGPAGLVRARVVDFEWRALSAFADTLWRDARVRPWLPVRRQPQLAPDGRTVHRVGAPPLTLTPGQAAVLAAVDNARTAAEIAEIAVAAPDSGLRRPADAELALRQLVEGGVLRDGLDLPYHLGAEAYLRSIVDGIGDPAARVVAQERFARLDRRRREVAGAAGDPDALRAALSDLAAEFTDLTGAAEVHRAGETYVGRSLVYEDTLRDLEVSFGGPLLDALAAPFAVLFQAARWLTVAVADAYTAALRDLYREADRPEVPLGDLWSVVNSVMFGGDAIAAVMADFTRRWRDLLDLPADATGPVHRDPADLADRVRDLFPAGAPGWPAARTHSPDLHLSAAGPEALARGEFTAVLGELHVAWLTCDNATFTRFHPDPGALRAAARRDLGSRVRLLFPTDYPQLTARIAESLAAPDDVWLGYTPAPARPGTEIVPLAALTLSEVDGDLVVTFPHGGKRSAVEVFGTYLSALAVNAFKLVTPAPHTPRVSLGRLVVQRETWRCTVADTGLAETGGPGAVRGEAARYLAARRWRAALGLPERVFARVGTEIKPTYVDFTSPAYVSAFAAMLRAAHRAGGPDVEVTVSELLPGPEEAWLLDGAGHRYSCELRLTAVDPQPFEGYSP